MDCHCFYCTSNKPHPLRHNEWYEISHKLLVAESLDPKDTVRMEACVLCGHHQPMLEDN